jgi:hypothetical protein
VLDTILVPGQTSNCNWGDADRRTLYITSGNSVYRIRLAATTGVGEKRENIPAGFDLFPNYPNPFNPETTIRYSLPGRSHVTLSVFNALGQQASTLVDGNQEAGLYSVRFDGSGMASGVYFYTLRADDRTATRRFILLR